MTIVILGYFKQMGIDLIKIDRNEYLDRLFDGMRLYDDLCPIWKMVKYI